MTQILRELRMLSRKAMAVLVYLWSLCHLWYLCIPFQRAPAEGRALTPTCMAAIPNDNDCQDTSTNPAAFIRAASSGSAGKFATDLGRYLYAVRWPEIRPPTNGNT